MPDYIFKTYLADGREHFLYGEMGDSRAQLTKKDFPFPESLLRLLYLDVWAYDGQIKQFDKLLMELYRTREEKCARQLLPLLDELAELHIYFQLLRLDWRARFKEAQRRNYENILDLLPHKEITHIPSNIHAIQNQVLGLIQKALDMDGRKGSLEKKLEDYYAREEREPLKVFHFHPQLMDFERVEGQRFVEVLCPRNIYDLIDFSVRECLKQEIKMRVCKNCGHWFAITGRTNAEYCEVTARRSAPSPYGTKTRARTRSSRSTAGSTKSALPGSRASGSTRRCSTSGAPRPGRRRTPVSVAS